MTVGERIKLKREELNITQDELARKMGYSGRSSICKVEAAGDIISTKKIKSFAEALGVTPAYLMGWEDSDPEPEAIENEEINRSYVRAMIRIDKNDERFKSLIIRIEALPVEKKKQILAIIEASLAAFE